MTKVTLHYDLTRPLGDDDFPNVSGLHSVYGIVRVLPNATLDKLTVDYDASRLMKKDVEAKLALFGMPLKAALA
ncbi:MAG: hypothetical protein WDO18_06625 [Acidobacteriota bacterium]